MAFLKKYDSVANTVTTACWIDGDRDVLVPIQETKSSITVNVGHNIANAEGNSTAQAGTKINIKNIKLIIISISVAVVVGIGGVIVLGVRLL